MPTKPIQTPQLPEVPSGQEFLSWQDRQRTASTLSALNAHYPAEALVESLPDNNNWLSLSSQPSQKVLPATIVKARTTYMGVPGTILGNITISGTAILSQVRVTGVVSVLAGGTLIATNCKFDQQVQVANTANAHFIGCFTKGVNNAGVALDCYIIGCHRDGGADAGAITIIAQTT